MVHGSNGLTFFAGSLPLHTTSGTALAEGELFAAPRGDINAYTVFCVDDSLCFVVETSRGLGTFDLCRVVCLAD